MSASTLLLGYAVLGGAALTLGDILFKYWIGNSSPWFYASGLALYVLGILVLIKMYRFENIAVATTLLVLSNIIILVVVSWLLFREPLSSTQILGIVLAVLAVIVLEIK